MGSICAVLLWSIVAVLGLSIVVLWRRRGGGALGFLAMLGANLLLALLALRSESPGGPLCVLAIGVFCAIVVAPSMLVALVRVACRQERFVLAHALVGVRQLLQPGLGLERERQLVEGLALASRGRGTLALQRARARLARCAPEQPERLAQIEQLMALFFFDRQPAQAVALFEAEGGPALARRSPSLCISAVRAYGEVGNFEAAARYLWLLEMGATVAGEVDAAGGLLNASRLQFLAHLGRVDEVERLVEVPGFALTLGAARRQLWRALALGRAGRGEEARQLWGVLARQRRDRVARAVALRRLDQPDPVLAPATLEEGLGRLVALVMQRALAHRVLPQTDGPIWQVAPAAVVMLLALVGVYAAQRGLAALPRWADEGWLLLRCGANFPPLSLGAQPWRLLANAFLHGGPYHLHLLFNAYALYLLGRMTEPMYGWRRWLPIYVLSAFGGSLASAALGRAVLSVGASGAISGLLGAAVAALLRLRGHVPERWRSRLFVNLLVVIGMQLVIGLQVELIDNAAHLGGLATGALAGWFAAPQVVRPDSGWRRHVASVASALALAACVLAGTMALLQGERDCPRPARHDLSAAGITLRLPTHWEISREEGRLALQDPLLTAAPTLQQVVSPQWLGAKGGAAATREALVTVYRQLNERTREQRQVRALTLVDAVPRRVGPGLWRGVVRVLAGPHELAQSTYFRLEGGRLHVLLARLPVEREAIYQPLIDEVVASVHLSGG
ncbi:MAG: rhomboid family intramembrane serine protease [Proteobacteria bacterium]|nr:rhomboid family intramembrane serine protease [Pseudomonadota bacterium]